MIWIIAILIALIPIGALWMERGRFTPIVFITSVATPILIGYAELDAIHGTITGLWYGTAIVLFVGGYFSVRLFATGRPAKTASKTPRSAPGLGLAIFASAVIGLAAYHFTFAFSGIPLLSDDVETARFDFTSSGLFGLPGRMFLFGLPFTVLLVSVAHGRRLARISPYLLYGTWGSYGLAALFSGFKGGPVSVLSTMLLYRTLIGKPLSLPRLAVGWRALVATGAVAYCVAISFRYKSLGLEGPSDVLPYLAARATTSAAAPGHLAWRHYGSQGMSAAQFGDDASYFMTKYFPALTDGEAPFPLDKKISAVLYHTELSKNAFIVPVTVGAFPELVVNVGLWFALPAMFGLGWMFAVAVSRAQTDKSIFRTAVYGFAIYLVQIYVSNGNLVYTVVNFGLIVGFLGSLYTGCYLICRFVNERTDWQPPNPDQ